MFKCFNKEFPYNNKPREFQFNTYEFDKHTMIRNFPNNFIKTSKYSAFSFFPVCLMYQFARYANIYFLFCAILASISIISPYNPISSWSDLLLIKFIILFYYRLPLAFVVGLSMTREGVEDINRHKSDIELNSSPTEVTN